MGKNRNMWLIASIEGWALGVAVLSLLVSIAFGAMQIIAMGRHRREDRKVDVRVEEDGAYRGLADHELGFTCVVRNHGAEDQTISSIALTIYGNGVPSYTLIPGELDGRRLEARGELRVRWEVRREMLGFPRLGTLYRIELILSTVPTPTRTVPKEIPLAIQRSEGLKDLFQPL